MVQDVEGALAPLNNVVINQKILHAYNTACEPSSQHFELCDGVEGFYVRLHKLGLEKLCLIDQ